MRSQRGFTLIELVMTIVLLGIIGGMVAVFMKSPIDAYVASASRAALTDVADTTVRRIARDVRRALPNSVNVPSSGCIEFIPTKTGGRYRTTDRTSGDGKALNFATADSSFNMLGANPSSADQTIKTGDVVVVYNLGITGSDAYSGNNTSSITSVTTDATATPAETTIGITARQFPLESGSYRFHVIDSAEQVVAYVCSGNALYRTVRSSISKTSAGSCPSVTGSPLLARNATCSFAYSGSDLTRNALVTMTLTLTENSETVTLVHSVNVNNTP